MSTLNNRKKHGPQRSGMTHAQWRRVQSLAPRWRWFFDIGKPGVNCTRTNPHTYNVGRNAAKRRRREASAYLRAVSR